MTALKESGTMFARPVFDSFKLQDFSTCHSDCSIPGSINLDDLKDGWQDVKRLYKLHGCIISTKQTLL